MTQMTWFKSHVFPNIYNEPIDVNGKPRIWNDVLLDNIDFDIKRKTQVAQLYVLVLDPYSKKKTLISVVYNPDSDADTIRSMIKASV